MKILYVTSEANPFAASGGLGDVLGALPTAVADMSEDISCDVIMPLYSSVKDEYRSVFEHVADISFMYSWRQTGATVYRAKKGNVNYYFVENHYYFDRPRLYGEYDDAERFAFFSLAVVEFMLSVGYVPDILHANDWQSAMTVVYLKTRFASNELLSSIKTVYTIHNIEYQGKFDPYILGDIFALDNEYLSVLEYDGCINLMKGALTVSDYITTVSPNYACELSHEFFAFGLQDVIKAQSHKMKGVINGIDYEYFSPNLGGDIYSKYTKRTVKSGKAKNKKMLLEELSLEYSPDVPLVVMITRLASQKGIDLLLHVAQEILALNLQLVILGTGEEEYEIALRELEERHSNLRALIKFDRALSKKMYAAADIFLMPSKFEPCGLAQMISCSYGTVPLVRAVGGLYDSIIPYGEDNSNGFRFNNYNAHELLYTLKDAVSLFGNKPEWEALRRRAINSDFSWQNSAKKYVSIYEDLLK